MNPHDVLILTRGVGLDRREAPVSEHVIIEMVDDTLRQTVLGDSVGFRTIDYEEAWQLWNAGSAMSTVDEATTAQARLNKQHNQPRFALVHEGAAWSHEGDSVTGTVRPLDAVARIGFPESVLDIPALGAAPFVLGEVFSFRSPPATLHWQNALPESSSQGDRRVESLLLEYFGSVYRMEWVLDGACGGQPVRTTLYENDRVVYSATTSLQKVGGRWFPKKVDFYRDDFAGGREPYMTIRVDEASFDEPWHRQAPFTPEDIGFVFGTQLNVDLQEYSHVQSKLGAGHTLYWDGVEMVPADDYWAMIYLYGMEQHPSIVDGLREGTGWSRKQYLEWSKSRAPIFRRRWEKAYGPIDIPGRQKNAEEEDDWDAFVREFIVKHKLSGERKDLAHGLLKHSKGLRDFHNRKYKKAIEQAKAAGELKRSRKLEEPMARIFKFLKRGLWRLVPPSERKRE